MSRTILRAADVFDQLEAGENPAGTLLEPNRRRQMVIATILVFLAILAKASALARGVTTDALLAAGLVIALDAALLGADVLGNGD